jgi:hypothetical protein
MEEMFRQMIAGGTAAAGRLSGSAGPFDPVSPALGVMGQVGGAFVASGLRYWARLAEIWTRAMPALALATARAPGSRDGGAEAGAALTDELRAVLRELADLPCQESRRLQAELDRLTTSGAAPVPDADAPYWRRWDAKP